MQGRAAHVQERSLGAGRAQAAGGAAVSAAAAGDREEPGAAGTLAAPQLVTGHDTGPGRTARVSHASPSTARGLVSWRP